MRLVSCFAAPLSFLLLLPVGATAGEPYAVVNGPQGPVRTLLFSEQNASLPVAQVEGSAVTLQDLAAALADMHSLHGEADKAGKTDFRPVLDRLIGARLLALEAHEMGLDELPEVVRAVDSFRIAEARDLLTARLTRDVKPDANQVELYFRESVREWKLKSVLFEKEADASEAAAVLKKGGDFDEQATLALGTRKATGGGAGEFVSASQMLPPVAAAVSGLFGGQVSSPIHLQNGWALVKVEEIRYPDDPKARASAEAKALEDAREEALKKIYQGLVKQYATVNQKLLDKLDFEKKKPGFLALEKDQRVIARVKGEPDLTVAGLAIGIRATFYHGLDEALKMKKINEQKYPVFNKMLYRLIFDAEAARQQIAGSDEFKRAVGAHRDGLVFDQFLRRVILPEVKITEDEGKAYYAQHKAEFSYPAMYNLHSLSFFTSRAAESAMKKLKGGTDLAWLRANADGQVPEDKRDVDFNGTTFSERALPPQLLAQLAGARSGDVRLYASGGQTHVVVVKQVTPAQPQPYAEVRTAIAQRISGEKVNKALDEWVGKLRKAHEVKVYLAQIGT